MAMRRLSLENGGKLKVCTCLVGKVTEPVFPFTHTTYSTETIYKPYKDNITRHTTPTTTTKQKPAGQQ